MKSDQTILEEAKDKVVKNSPFKSWDFMASKSTAEMELFYLKQATEVALKIKGDEMEKEIDDFKRAIKENRDVTISNLKFELSQAREDNERMNSIFTEQSYELQDLKSTLSQEKAKAFDEGCDKVYGNVASNQTLSWGDKEYNKDALILAKSQNPYTPKDLTQKK